MPDVERTVADAIVTISRGEWQAFVAGVGKVSDLFAEVGREFARGIERALRPYRWSRRTVAMWAAIVRGRYRGPRKLSKAMRRLNRSIAVDWRNHVGG